MWQSFKFAAKCIHRYARGWLECCVFDGRFAIKSRWSIWAGRPSTSNPDLAGSATEKLIGVRGM